MSEWISVKDKTPFENQSIIAWGPDLVQPIQMTYRVKQYNAWINCIIGSWEHVTHWQPLPEPPK